MVFDPKLFRPPRNYRLDDALYRCPGSVYFFTIRAYRGSSPFSSLELSAQTITALVLEQARLHCQVYVYCLMPDHLHFLLSPLTDRDSVLAFVAQYKGRTTRMAWQCGWKGRLWQPRYYEHVVRTEEGVRATADYILANPVRKGLVQTPNAWPWAGQLNPLPL